MTCSLIARRDKHRTRHGKRCTYGSTIAPAPRTTTVYTPFLLACRGESALVSADGLAHHEYRRHEKQAAMGVMPIITPDTTGEAPRADAYWRERSRSAKTRGEGMVDRSRPSLDVSARALTLPKLSTRGRHRSALTTK